MYMISFADLNTNGKLLLWNNLDLYSGIAKFFFSTKGWFVVDFQYFAKISFINFTK